MAQAMAAAGKAGALLAHGKIEKEPLTAQLIPDLCAGCMRCVKVCPYSAIEQIGKPGKDGTVKILEAACMGCGTCAAECNFSAIEMPYFTKNQILAQIDAALQDRPEEKCLVFTCNWCSYAGADLAGIEKRQYPASSRIIRTMCSARFEEEFITHAFDQGAGAVLVTGAKAPKLTTREMLKTMKPGSVLVDVAIDYAWGGTLAVTLKRMPHFGRLDRNQFYAQGYSGHGVGTATLALALQKVGTDPAQRVVIVASSHFIGNDQIGVVFERIKHAVAVMGIDIDIAYLL